MDDMACEVVLRMGNRNYKCNICGKYFYRKCHINRHMIVHAGQVKFNCKFCKMQFTLHSELHKHMLLHTGETLYKCEICGRKYSQSGGLNRHRALHSEEKIYECEVCLKQYTHRSSLMRHSLVHDSEVRYGCGECRKQFNDKESFLIHVQRKECVSSYQYPKMNKHVVTATEKKEAVKSGDVMTPGNAYGVECLVKTKMTDNNSDDNGPLWIGSPIIKDTLANTITENSKLIQHSILSSGTEIPQCKVCFKLFSYRNSLYRHLHVIHPEINCGCRNCEKRFAGREVSHTDEKGVEEAQVVDHDVQVGMKFGCGDCCEQFKSKEALVMHVEAEKCSESFKQHHRESIGPLASVSGYMSKEFQEAATTSDNHTDIDIANEDEHRIVKEEVICKEDFIEGNYDGILIKKEIPEGEFLRMDFL